MNLAYPISVGSNPRGSGGQRFGLSSCLGAALAERGSVTRSAKPTLETASTPQCNRSAAAHRAALRSPAHTPESASVLIIVLWICIGLVSIALYFANSMSYELQAADNRVSGLSADQAIEGAARYVSYALSKVSGQPLLSVGDDFAETDLILA